MTRSSAPGYLEGMLYTLLTVLLVYLFVTAPGTPLFAVVFVIWMFWSVK